MPQLHFEVASGRSRPVNPQVRCLFNRVRSRTGQLMLGSGVWLIISVAGGLSGWGQTRPAERPRETPKSVSGENDPVRVEGARSLIAKSIEAYGGTARLTGIANLSFVSQSATEGGQAAQFKVYLKGSEKFRSEILGPNFFAMTIADGPNAWLKSDSTLIELAASDVQSLKLSTLLQSQPYMLFDRLAKFWDEGERVVEGNTLHLLGTSGFLGTNFTRGDISLDPRTLLIRRFEYEQEVESPQGRGVKKYDLRFETHQSAEGVFFPTKVISIQSGTKSTITISDFKINPDIPDSFFDKPK